MHSNAYLGQPSLFEDQIIFVTDDDIWATTQEGGRAVRLTTSEGQPSRPLFSPDGQWIAYSSSETGTSDIYLMSCSGGEVYRLTHVGGCELVSWLDNDNLVIGSTFESFNARASLLYKLDIHNDELTPLKLGPANAYSKTETGSVILGRNLRDPARWKRYKGGTAGTLWLDPDGKGKFRQLFKKIGMNPSRPTIYKNRLYFVSDHEGIGNIYSSSLNGTGMKRITNRQMYYVRDFAVHNGTIVYQVAGDLHRCDINGENDRPIDIHVPSNFVQSRNRFEPAGDYLTGFAPDSEGSRIAAISRGQLFSFHPWQDGVLHGSVSGERLKRPRWSHDGKHLFAVRFTDEGEERLCQFDRNFENKKQLPGQPEWGKIKLIKPCPNSKFIAVATWRQELWLYCVEKKKAFKVDTSNSDWNEAQPYQSVDWSPDGRWLVFNSSHDERRSAIKICDATKAQPSACSLITPVLSDWSPQFSPCGRYLYFLGIKEFYPTFSETHSDLGFPFASRPYVVLLKKGSRAPWEEQPQTKENKKEKKDEKIKVDIDFDKIEDRVLPLPLPIGGYLQLGVSKNRIVYLRQEVAPINPYSSRWGNGLPTLNMFLTKECKEIWLADKVFDVSLSPNKQWVLFDTEKTLRIHNLHEISEDLEDEGESEFSRKTGKIKAYRMNLRVDPVAEWEQMFKEAWVLQKENFWSDDMSKVDWEEVYHRYHILLPKIHTRRELSDLLWEMQGELGTSHAYEFEGDYYRQSPYNPLAELGAELKWIESSKCYEVTSILESEKANPFAKPPLRDHRALIDVGDRIFDVDGLSFEDENTIKELLLNKGGSDVSLRIQRKKSSSKERVTVRSLPNQEYLLYKQWVEENKKKVHELSDGKIGYIHIPDMSLYGFSEFYRHFLVEIGKEGLVVDVRYNGGGNVSEHILKVLAQKTIGYCVPRHMGVFRYPAYSNSGAMVCLTNEQAGSDGDIFSHSFKLMNLGPLIGKRTWGGVIGIWPREMLADGTITSQPQFSFWFNDVGWSVENYGTDPDIEVDITPQDYKEGRDPQLERSVLEALKRLKKVPRPPSFHRRPQLPLPSISCAEK